MKFLKTGLGLAVAGASLAFVPGSPSAAVGAGAPAVAPDDGTLVQKMRGDASGDVAFSAERSTGKVSFARALDRNGDLLPSVEGHGPHGKAAAANKADAYLDKYAQAFGSPAGDLVQTGVVKNEHGFTVSYLQRHNGVDVFGALIRAHVDGQGDLTAVNGELIPVGDIATTPAISKTDAGARAVKMVRAMPPGDSGKADTSGIKAKNTQLVIYKRGFVQGLQNGKTELVWQVEVTNEENIRDMVFLSALTGKQLNRYTMIDNALDRLIYTYNDATGGVEYVWGEGEDPSVMNEEQANLAESAGEAYWLYKNAFGRDSYDGEGGTMLTLHNRPDSCPNASWNGSYTSYCPGVYSDDVVSHEWAHAYTEYTHGLIYQWQSGALNEGYSDVFGETLDLINNREDEGEGNLNAPRPVGQCSTHSPWSSAVTINAPAAIQGECESGAAQFGPPPADGGITGDIVLALDAADATGPETDDACTAITNGAEVTGMVALVKRGSCDFSTKVYNAQQAGAIAVLIMDHTEGFPDGLGAGANADLVTVPSARIRLSDGDKIRTELDNGETVNVTLADGAGERHDSYRWLIGEKADAFGGAIRDMWNPTCYGDPGKVSDVEYKCSTDDNGGVHGNSGVVNRGYSLLVDGGTYNEINVAGIGLTKALAIYYKAMTEYQTPVSNFVDHADSLVASCNDLVGKAIKELSVEEADSRVAYDKITTADCASVQAMTDAVEFRLDPTEKCGWEPTLDKNTPAICGEGFSTQEIFTEDFEDGFDGWELTGENPFGGILQDWEVAYNYRGEHDTAVAKGPAGDKGDCAGGSTDFSSVAYLTSGMIIVPADVTAPRMQFDHYIATETGYDGGNLQVSVNGGDFAAVPADAFTFNAPATLTTDVQGSTNPLEGQPGFTGTDPGAPFGSWGTSQVDLSVLGVGAGDGVQLRFAIGRDGCGGVDGWYVDNVEVVACVEKAEAAVSAVHTTEPSTYGQASTVDVTIDGGDATGTVMLLDGETSLGSADVAAGAASIPVPDDLDAGTHALAVSYSGDDTYGASSADVTVTVAKAATKTTAKAKTKKVKKGKKARIKVKVKASGVTPDGKIQLKLGKKVIGKGTLNKNGVVTIRTKALKKVGKLKIKVIYKPGSNFKSSRTKVTVRVKK